ncbi:MAG: MlaD family protein, partial [Saprospiraceae bacterium]|nr:MlaD family protein [Saprospiraceae bacterium]
MSNESKIAILALVATALFFYGYKFIQGKNLLSTSNIYFSEYNNVQQLKMSSPVLLNGYQVGQVSDIFLNPDNHERVIVKLDLNPEIRVPPETKAIIVSTGFMGSKAIRLQYDQPCRGEDCARSGSYLIGESRGLVGSMVSPDDLEEYMAIVKGGLQEVIDTLNRIMLSEESDSPIARTMQDLQVTVGNLRNSSNRLDQLLSSSSGNIDSTLANLSAITGNIAERENQINDIILNAETITRQVSEADLNRTIDQINHTMTDLQMTRSSADTAVAAIVQTLERVNAGQGTLGRLI